MVVTREAAPDKDKWARAEPHNMEHGNTVSAAQRGPIMTGIWRIL